MKTRMLKTGLALLLLPVVNILYAQQVDSFTVKQAVDYALKNAVQVKNALLDIEIQKQVNREVTAAAYPQINGTGNLSFNPNVAVQTFPNFIAASTYGVLQQQGVKDGSGNPIVAPADFGVVQAQFGSKYTVSGGFSASQLLFDGQVFAGLLARKATIDFSKKTAEVTEELIKANVYKIYYQLVIGRKQIASIDANIERYQKLLSDTREIYKNGFAEKLDVNKAQVQLSNLQTEKLKAENQLIAGNDGLKFLLNMPQKDQLILTDTLSDEEIKANILDESYNYSDRKEYQQLSILSRLNKYNIQRYKLSKIPTVALSANYNKNAQSQEFDFFNNGKFFTSSFVGLSINVPIFDGGAKNARISQAKLDFRKTQNNIEQLKASVDNDIEQARINFKTALLTMDTQKKNIELAEEVYNSTKLKFEQGLGSNLEVSNAQADLSVAQNNYYGSLYDAINAKIDYLKAAGKL